MAARLDFGLTRGRKISAASFVRARDGDVFLEMANAFGFGWFWHVLVNVVAHARHAKVLDVSPSFL